MKKHFKILIFGLPVLLLLLASTMDFSANSSGVIILNTSLLDYDYFWGSINSVLFPYLMLSFLGITFLISTNEYLVSLGKALYSIAMTIGMFLLFIMIEISGLTTLGTTNVFSLGGIMFLTGAILGIILALTFLLIPIIDEIIRKFYGRNSIVTGKENSKDPFSSIREWKLMLDENVISDEEYNLIKEDLLNGIKFKKGTLITIITTLKSLEQEGLISNEDFELKKKEALLK